MELVVTSLEPWDTVWRRNQHLVAGLLRRDPNLRVLFVEPATDPLHAALGSARPARGRGLRAAPAVDGIRPGSLWLLEPTKWLPRRLDRELDQRWAKQVIRAARQLELTKPILWVNDPTGALLVEAARWPALYDITDDWLAADRSKAAFDRIVAQESILLASCKEVVVCSPVLKSRKRAVGRMTLVPNGVDASAYATALARPADLPAGPVALYAGTLHSDRLDVPVCVRLAEALKGRAELVLLGPDALPLTANSALTSAGAVLLGSRPSADVPAYLQNADVLVVPHVVTPFTDSLDPIKLYEYRAAGRPVVSTPVAGFRDVVDDRVTVVDREGFPEGVAAALSERDEPMADDGHDAGRALDVDWGRRVAQMTEVLARLSMGAAS